MANRRSKDSKVPSKGWFRLACSPSDEVDAVFFFHDGCEVLSATITKHKRGVSVTMLDRRLGASHSEAFEGKNPVALSGRVLSLIDFAAYSIGAPGLKWVDG